MKKIIISLFILLPFFLESQIIPRPDKDLLYTEFVSTKKLRFLKKPVISTGYIAMSGRDSFIYKQNTPSLIEIRKSNDTIFYKKDKMTPIEVDISSGKIEDDFSIVLLFGSDDETILKHFTVESKPEKDKTRYKIVPRGKSKIKEITAYGRSDKLFSIEMIYLDESTLRYEFSNSITGQEIDEKYFQ